MSTVFEDTRPHRPDVGGDAQASDEALRPPSSTFLDSQVLLRGGRAVTIRHNGEIYRLQATRQGKLILTK